jgi:hypothetical protein
MKFIDYFLYVTYRFAHLVLKKNEGDAKWSAFLHTGVYITILIISIICFVGLLFDNPISLLFKEYTLLSWMSIFILTPVILSFRYYSYSGISPIEESYLLMSEIKQKGVNKLIYSLMAALPIILFVLFRLYIIGSLKWW